MVNFPLTGNDICHSQPKPWYFIISNVSHSIHLFLAQWRHISSESAVIISDINVVTVPNVMPNSRHGIFYCINICGRKICAINAQAANQTKLQLKWFFQCDLRSLSNSRAPGGPVTICIIIIMSRFWETMHEAGEQKNGRIMSCYSNSNPIVVGLGDKFSQQKRTNWLLLKARLHVPSTSAFLWAVLQGAA